MILLSIMALVALSADAKLSMSRAYKRHDAEGARAYHLAQGNVSELFMPMNINHFTSNGTSATFPLRYLLDESHVSTSNPPILFYTGNEADVWTFYNNTGFVTQVLAPMFGAVVLFAEHRFYGKSLPFGAQSFQPGNVNMLTVDQALMDYVKLIKAFKAANASYTYSPVIAFGGSYGGMLSAWFRMKYPHIVAGAHAASAPILFFPGGVSPYAFNELVTRNYNTQCPGIKDSTRKGFQLLADADPANFAAMTSAFKTCTPVTTAQQARNLADQISGALGTMQMVDYPYASDFLGALPANPVHTACSWAQGNFTNPQTPADYFGMLAIMLNVFDNSTGTNNCTWVGLQS